MDEIEAAPKGRPCYHCQVIPLRDLNPARSRAWVTYAIIAINLVVLLHEKELERLSYGGFGPFSEPDENSPIGLFIRQWGLVPYWITTQPTLGAFITPFTSMFLHGGWLHFLSNMWFLHIFGDNVEDYLGRVKYILFYFGCGLGAAAAQVLAGPRSEIPMVGASGAIAGVLGAYVVLFPKARITTIIPVFIFLQFVDLPAVVFLFVWFGLQVLMGLGTMGAATTGGVAFMAHIGGFVVGWFWMRILKARAANWRA